MIKEYFFIKDSCSGSPLHLLFLYLLDNIKVYTCLIEVGYTLFSIEMILLERERNLCPSEKTICFHLKYLAR